MNTEERVLTTLRCEQPDRVPVFLYLNPYVDGWYTEDPTYAEVLETCKAYGDVIYDWHPKSGFFCSMADLKPETRDIGGGLKEHVLHTPRGPITQVTKPDWRGCGVIKRWIKTEEDARRVLSIPDADPRPDITEFLETRERLKGLAVGQLTFSDPICFLGAYADEVTLATWTIEKRDLILEFLDVALARMQRLLKHCLDAGAGPIYYFNGPEYALPPLMSPRDFEAFVTDYDRRLIELIHSYPDRYTIIHSHGRVNRFLESFVAMGTDGLNVLEPPPLGDVVLLDAKGRVGDRMCLIGNIQYDDLVTVPQDELDRMIRESIEAGAPGGGFILSPCASPYERSLTPKKVENMIAYLKKGHAYGAYPALGRSEPARCEAATA